MSSKYKFDDREGVYFVTSTVVDWIDVFTRDMYRNIVLTCCAVKKMKDV